MPDAGHDISRPRLIRNGSFLKEDRREIRQRRRGHNRLGFAYQSAFVRVVGRFPRQERLEIDEESLRFAALQLGTNPDAIEAYAERRQTVSEHQRRIRSHLKLRPFDALMLSFDAGVICDGFRTLGKPPPPATIVTRPPPEAFEHPEEEDPMRAVGRWLDETLPAETEMSGEDI